ncbi:MAG: BlaI/MecI/CopY family transcriptional regulator [Acidobacteriota bacterium]
MARQKAPISDTELSVLKTLWTQGAGTVRDIEGRLPRRQQPLAYNTILTLLSRLRQKGYVSVDRRDTAHVFRAAVTRDEVLGQGLATLARRICDGTASPLVHALVRGRHLSPHDIADLRQLLDDLASEE